jgi:fucose 4-O-acetylase-like acetyltransferase
MSSQRVVSLDQFRGYTVAGMFLVNFLGSFAVTPAILKHHHDYCSYADTIMPQFLFAVGFAFRLTFERRVQQHGASAAYRRVINRLLGLVLLSVIIYTIDRPADTWAQLTALGPWPVLGRALKRDWFQTLMHIAVTSLWILPVIRSRTSVRISFAVASAFLHVLLSWWFNFAWCNSSPNAIDGGPLGFLTWTIPAIAGTIACDLVIWRDLRTRWTWLIAGSVGLMLSGWIASCGTRFYDVPPDQTVQLQDIRIDPHPVVPRAQQLKFHGLAELPFVAPPDAVHRKWNYWMMSQRAGTLSYLTFGAGVSLAVFCLFHLLCDFRGHELYVFRVLGNNALTGYVFHILVMRAVKPFVPKDAPLWYVATSLFVFFGITWVLLRHLEKNEIHLRL